MNNENEVIEQLNELIGYYDNEINMKEYTKKQIEEYISILRKWESEKYKWKISVRK